MGSNLHLGFALGGKNHRKLAKRDSCSSGGFITSPASGDQIDVSQEVEFTWDSSCLNITGADIYLYAPYEDSTLVQMFENVDFSKGYYNTTLKPKWWNSTSSIQLELTILNTGDHIWQSTLPAGPIWTANYDSSKSDANSGTTSSGETNVTKVDNFIKKIISKGGIAAAVIVPLLAVAAIGIFVFIRLQRQKEEERRRARQEMVDKRMSVISQDWRSITARGHEAAVRASVYSSSHNRSSVWSAGAGIAGVGYGLSGVPRTSSTYAAEGEPSVEDDAKTDAVQRRPGVGLRGPIASTAGSTTRVSRVSFAADTRFSRASTGANLDGAIARPRPSGESRRAGVASRAFHSAYIPPVPTRPSQYVLEDDFTFDDGVGVGAMSPTQRFGALDLTADDIQARMSGVSTGRPSADGIFPALAMMRENNSSQADLILSPKQEYSTFHEPMMKMPEPEPALPERAKSPITESFHIPMPIPMPTPAPAPAPLAMSPDEMLRAYAAQRRLTSSSMSISSPISRIGSPVVTMSPVINVVTGLAYPMPVANPSATPTEMRQLFASPPPQNVSASSTEAPIGNVATHGTGDKETNPFRKSVAVRHDDDTNGAGSAF